MTTAILRLQGLLSPQANSDLRLERLRSARTFLVPMIIALIVAAGLSLLRTIFFSASPTNGDIVFVQP